MTLNQTQKSGNILFIILIAIGLFSLLGAVVMDGENTTNKVTEDKAKIYAQDIIAYANAMEGVVQRMLDRGISENDLCFDYDEYPGGNADYEHAACSETKNRVFHADGGGMRYQTPPDTYFDQAFSSDFRTGQYIFNGSTEIVGIPQFNENSTDVSELLMTVHGIKLDICMAIIDMLDFPLSATSQPLVDGVSATFADSRIYYDGVFDDTAPTSIAVSGNLNILRGRESGCIQESSSSNLANAYTAFFVLHAR